MLMDEDVVVAGGQAVVVGGQAVERVGGWVGGWVDRMASGDMRNRVRGLPHFLRHGWAAVATPADSFTWLWD